MTMRSAHSPLPPLENIMSYSSGILDKQYTKDFDLFLGEYFGYNLALVKFSTYVPRCSKEITYSPMWLRNLSIF